MRVNAFAPHLAGLMLPGLFSTMPFTKKPRFEGDPWATFPHSPTWFWMCTTECGTPNHVGSYSSRPIARQPFPADLDALFVSLPAAAQQPRATALQAVLFPETA